MKFLFLLSFCFLLLCSPHRARSEETFKMSSRKTVSFNVRRNVDDVNIVWLCPEELSDTLDAFASDEERSAFCLYKMNQQAEAGNTDNEYKLGYLYLNGIAVERDLIEAERRFRIGLEEIERPIGARRLAEALVFGDETEQDFVKAAELALASMAMGYEKASYVAQHIAYYYYRESDPRDPKRAQELYDAIVAVSPQNDYVLYLSACVRLDRGLYDDAWDRANEVIDLPDVSEDYANRSRVIRLQVAQKLGYEKQLVAADYIVPMKKISERLPVWLKVTGATFFLTFSTGLLVLLAWLTRRKGNKGPGIWLTILWILISATIGSAILLQSKLLMLGVFICAVIILLLAIDPAKRRLYFPAPSAFSARWVKRVGEVIVFYLLLGVALGIYAWVYSVLFGNPPDNQMIAMFLQVDGVLAKVFMFICVALLIPLIEEIVFRGFLIDLLRRKLSWVWAIIISSLIFGILHGITAFVPIVLLGGVMGYFRYRYKDLWSSVALHCLNNAISIVMIWLGFS